MTGQVSLREAERRTFRLAFEDGLWDMFLGACVLSFILALYLSPLVGDFWSSMAMVPIWALGYAAMHLIRKYVVAPRLGTVRLGPSRRARLSRLSLALLLINAVGLLLGLAAAFSFGRVPGQIIGIVFGMLLLCVVSAAAYFLDFPRLYAYGLLLGISPAVGEWLWMRGLVAHHGIPVTFGITGGILIAVGLVIFIRLMRLSSSATNSLP